jgi:lysophospholipase L1-like esterase
MRAWVATDVEKNGRTSRLRLHAIGDAFLGADGSIPKELMPDFLHLTPKGYEMWAEAIFKQIAK